MPKFAPTFQRSKAPTFQRSKLDAPARTQAASNFGSPQVRVRRTHRNLLCPLHPKRCRPRCAALAHNRVIRDVNQFAACRPYVKTTFVTNSLELCHAITGYMPWPNSKSKYYRKHQHACERASQEKSHHPFDQVNRDSNWGGFNTAANSRHLRIYFAITSSWRTNPDSDHTGCRPLFLSSIRRRLLWCDTRPSSTLR